MIVPDEGFSRQMSGALNYISTFVLCDVDRKLTLHKIIYYKLKG